MLEQNSSNVRVANAGQVSPACGTARSNATHEAKALSISAVMIEVWTCRSAAGEAVGGGLGICHSHTDGNVR